jgi:hypothetical protein
MTRLQIVTLFVIGVNLALIGFNGWSIKRNQRLISEIETATADLKARSETLRAAEAKWRAARQAMCDELRQWSGLTGEVAVIVGKLTVACEEEKGI